MPLTQDEISVIKATIPILEGGGELLTRHFYARMMRENPEVRKFFNQTSQANGSQAKALANAVLRYAKNIEHLENLGPTANAIVQRHVALDIQPEHYPIVGTNLIHSMREVLGAEVATDQVLDAWTKAYNQLANILIGAEAQVYKKIEQQDLGGWKDFREFVIQKKTPAAHNVVSFDLVPDDGKVVYKTVPGQYITLRVFDNNSEERRSYSVSSAPSSEGYRISVKNIGAVSKHLHSLPEGSKVELRPPMGSLIWSPEEGSSRNNVFIAGGIGITPLAAMALAGAPATLLYYAHSDEYRALANELKALSNVKWIEVANRPTSEELAKYVTNDVNVYCVGPHGFMNFVRDTLTQQGFPMENYHYEVFGSNTD